MAQRRAVPSGRLHRDESHPTGKTGRPVLQSEGNRRAMDQGGQECGEVDAAVVPRIRRQQGPTASLRPGLQPWELPSTAGPAARDQALDPDNDSGEIDQDWGKDRSPCPPGGLPAG